MDIDINHQVPFSRYGAYTTFNIPPARWEIQDLLLRSVYHFRGREAFRLQLISEGGVVASKVEATESVLTMRAENGPGRVEICYQDEDIVRLRGQGVGLRLSTATDQRRSMYAFPAGTDCWHVNSVASHVQMLLRLLSGRVELDAPHLVRTQDKSNPPNWPDRPDAIFDVLPGQDNTWELAIHDFRTSPRRIDVSCSFEDAARRAQQDWENFAAATLPDMPERYAEAGRAALLVNWLSTVRPHGNFRRYVTLMSKNWMAQCWSWDHCFNAIAMSYRNPELAWDQLNVHFDLQDDRGALPDGVTASTAGWEFCKPPIHGWTLMKLLDARAVDEARLEEFYPKLAAWTRWWFDDRDYDGDGLPEYHHGNDSGWDNGTIFDKGFPVAGPDLAAFLVLQCDVLADVAEKLGKTGEARNWRQQADATLQAMIDRLWTGEQFAARVAFSDEFAGVPGCTLNHMPIILGERLPEEYRRKVAAMLDPEGPHITENGPATERPDSECYVPDGYWRGPIWGSETVLLIDGLARSGYREQARQIARRYCDMCRRCGLFAENYNAVTGEPLRDPAYTWGSSAYLILAHELLL
jgi:glycogen debranching enzyme